MTGEENVEVPTTVEVEFLGEAPGFGLDMRVFGFGDFKMKTLGGFPAQTVTMNELQAWKMKHCIENGVISGKFKFVAKPDGHKFAGQGQYTVNLVESVAAVRLDALETYEKALNDRAVKPEQVEVLKKAWRSTYDPPDYPGALSVPTAAEEPKSEEVL